MSSRRLYFARTMTEQHLSLRNDGCAGLVKPKSVLACKDYTRATLAVRATAPCSLYLTLRTKD